MSTLTERMVSALRAVDAMRSCPIVDDDFPLLRDRADSQLRDVLREIDAGAVPEGFSVIHETFAELRRATMKFPTWPTDPLHAVAVLGEEFGELTQAVLQATYEPHKATPEDVRTEAIQVAAMAIRFAMSLDRYVYAVGKQHGQVGGEWKAASNA